MDYLKEDLTPFVFDILIYFMKNTCHEFQTYFGGTLPEKFVNTQIPKYEAAYIAKSYLQQSNQLFVTRVLGLSGYDAGPSWTI